MSVTQHLHRWFDIWSAPETDWIQVEVSSRCSAACIYCPRTVFPDHRRDRDMNFATFQALESLMLNTDLVYLQGWGEPLLHPRFFDMVSMARRFGCRVGTSTNGMHIDTATVDRILDCGLDIIAFSLAGTGSHQDSIRRGTEFVRIVDAIHQLNRRKAERGLTRPDIHLAYLLLASRIDDLGDLPDLAAALKLNQVVISTLDFVPDETFLSETIFPDNDAEFLRYRQILDAVAANGLSRGVDIYYYLGRRGYTEGGCPENPTRAMFISVDGNVSPCFFHGLPDDIAEVDAAGQAGSHSGLVFGNIVSMRAGKIWSARNYQTWRKEITRGDFHRCGTCRKRHLIGGGST